MAVTRVTSSHKLRNSAKLEQVDPSGGTVAGTVAGMSPTATVLTCKYLHCEEESNLQV